MPPLLRNLIDRVAPMPRGDSVRVWPWTVRAFHWSLVLAVGVAAATGFVGGMSALTLHLVAGIAIPVLILLRIGVGLFGGGYARFDSFPPSKHAALEHLEDIRGGRHERHLGHNPLGALMVYTMMAVLLLIVLTGTAALAGMFKQGPFRGFIGFDAGWLIYGLHQPLAWLLMMMVAAHLWGVWFEGTRGHENLVAAMIHGRKAAEPPAPPPPARRAHPLLAAASGIGAVAVATLLVYRASTVPVGGLPPAKLDPAYAEQCGACHTPYSPVLAPAAVWRQLMGNLRHHFGEDASLGDARLHQRILDYLVANSAEHSDTLLSHRMMQRNPADPMRITATRFWRFMHGGIPARVFARKKVGGRGNCSACHQDARSGRFLPENIHIPE